MKKILAIVLVFLVVFLSGCNVSEFDENDKNVIVTSFYPVYIFTLNLIDGIDGVEVFRMAENNTGCLHDYTLTAKDAKMLSDADVLVINGAGMELFVEDLYKTVEKLPVIDSSEGIELICNDSHAHDHEEESHAGHDHNHSVNSHIWLSVGNAKMQVLNIKNGLVKAFPQYENQISLNCGEYLKRLDALDKQIKENYSVPEGKRIVTFHRAYDYMARDMGLEIAACIESDDGKEPSTKRLAQLCDEMREQNIKALFTESDYSGSAADIAASEIGARVYALNPVLKGEEKLTAYEEIMLENYRIIYEAVK